MEICTVKLDEKQADSLINDPEICPEESLHSMVLKIFQKAGKPLHYRDLVYVVVNKGYYEAHDEEIPQDLNRSIKAVLRQDRGISKLSQEIYGLSEWQNSDFETISNKEVDAAVQAIQQDISNQNSSSEEFSDMEKNCPKCDKKIDIKLHFCTFCGADLSGFCKNCLYEVKDHWIFCGNCGTKLEQRIRKSACV